LLLAGEGGIGKTRLAAEMAAMADATGGLALQSRCYASERSLFLQPFVDGPGPERHPQRPWVCRSSPR
jgi:hypothetical protein